MMQRLYLLGHPVAHSKSPAMHNAAYRALGLDWSYELADFESAEGASAFLRSREWRALNVTMPYKPRALQAADEASSSARAAQGANVLVNWDGRLWADNTDGEGCVSYLRRSGADFTGARVAVCGTGPTSLAILHACVQAGASDATLLGRDDARARRIIESYSSRVGETADARVRAGSYESGMESLASAQIIVDATPLGMSSGDPAPFDTSVLSAGQTVLDVVYAHGETALLKAARDAGCDVFDGRGMLVAQAVETVRDIAAVTGEFSIPETLDLFDVMAQAAGFDLG